MSEAPETLTPQERRVALAVSRGWRNRRIAEALGISERTVKKHVAAACKKMQVEGRVQLALRIARPPLRP